MPLTLISGPPKSGRAGEIRARLTAALPAEPVLVVPNSDDVIRFERELAEGAAAVLGASVRTFEGFFGDVADAVGAPRSSAARQGAAPPRDRAGRARLRRPAPARALLAARLPARARRDDHRASGGPRGAREPRARRGGRRRRRPPRRAGRRLPRIPGAARPARPRRPPPRRRARDRRAASRARRLGRPPGPRLRVRRPLRAAVRDGRGARRGDGGDGRRHLRGRARGGERRARPCTSGSASSPTRP